jgi:hypothetical protein
VATNSELALHPEVTPDQKIYMGGWTHHKNGEGYLVSCPTMIMPGALALTGRKNVSVKDENIPHPPSLYWLGSGASEAIGSFLNELCEVDVPQLSEGSALRCLVDTSVASLIMYHPFMKKD